MTMQFHSARACLKFSFISLAIFIATRPFAADANAVEKHIESKLSRALGIDRILLAVDAETGRRANDMPDRIVVTAVATTKTADQSEGGPHERRTRSLFLALAEAKRKIALVLYKFHEDSPIGGCRLVDCTFTDDSDGRSSTAFVAVEWTLNRQKRSEDESGNGSHAEIAEVLTRQFHDPKVDMIRCGTRPSETNAMQRLSAKVRAKFGSEKNEEGPDSYSYWQPRDIGSMLREYVPALATNSYAADGHVQFEIPGGLWSTPETRTSLASLAMSRSNMLPRWKRLVMDDATEEAFRNVAGEEDIESIKSVVLQFVNRNGLAKPAADPVEIRRDLLDARDETVLFGPFDWCDAAGFVHHLGCAVVQCDDRNMLSRNSAKRDAEAKAGEFAVFPMLAAVASADNRRTAKELLANPKIRTAVLFSDIKNDTETGFPVAVALVEALY